MSGVTGPISTLPGSWHSPPAGATCDDHPDRPAAARLQGETDSFGSEMIDLCAECRDASRSASHEPTAGTCDWCKCAAESLHPMRDYEEGMCGPVYQICTACRDRHEQRLNAEFDQGDLDWGDE